MIGEPAEWYIAFYDTRAQEGRRWWHWFTRPGFGHCCAFGYVRATETWILIDWTAEGLSVQALRGETVDALIVESVSRGVVLAARPCPGGTRSGLRLPVLYCVPMVKHLLGLDSWAVTPWQLFCELKRRGCPVMFSRTKEALDDAKQAEA